MDKLLDILKSVAPAAATIVGGPMGGLAVKAIADKFGVADSVEAVAQAIAGDPDAARKLEEMDLEQFKIAAADRASARDMQAAALAQDDVFSKRFIYYFASFWSGFSAIYFLLVTFVTMPQGARDFANIILGFLLGTALTSIFMFFYGSSKSSKDKTEAMLKGAK